MKKWIKAAALCALVWMSLTASALASDFQLSVRRADGVGGSVSMWEKSSAQYYLFLPSYMLNQPLEITFSGTPKVKMGEMSFESGMVTDALTDGVQLSAKKAKIDVMLSANLPAVHITTESGSLDYIHKRKGNKESGHVQIVTAEGETALDAPLDSFKGHGNATFVYEKKSYQIKLDKKAEFLGMNKGKNFVLLANQHENTLLRNRITFELARALELPHTPECANVDLYVNGGYRGSYLLCDKVTIAGSSVDITSSEDAIEFANEAFIEHGGKPERYGENGYEKDTYKGVVWPKEPEDITGGYLFELEYQDRYKDETSGVVTAKGQPIVVKEPEEMSAEQGEYAYALLSSFERAIFSQSGTDEVTGKHYTEIADFDSLVRKYMIEELCKNYDGNKSSQYFFKDSDEVDPMLYAGPVWDYDSAWGNYAQEGRLTTAEPKGLAVAENGFSYSWWPALYSQQDFAREVRNVYDSQLRGLLEVLTGEADEQPGDGMKSLDDYAAELDASARMNFTRWRVFNHNTRAVKTGATYEENIEYLRSWIRSRMAYLNSAW